MLDDSEINTAFLRLSEAERQGFELWVPLRLIRFSRPVAAGDAGRVARRGCRFFPKKSRQGAMHCYSIKTGVQGCFWFERGKVVV
jgi:hypothetical protein